MIHDQLFKDLIRNTLASFVRLFFPDMAAQIDFTQQEWLDKEAFTDLPRGFHRRADLVVKVRTTAHRPQLMVFLIELEDRQGRRRRTGSLEERLFVYYTTLWMRYKLPIIPLVVYLFKARDGIGRGRYVHKLLGYEIATLNYFSIGLPKLNAPQVLAESGANLPGKASIAAATLGALMDPGEWSRAKLKSECLCAIANARVSDALQFISINCVETYLRLDDQEQEVFEKITGEERFMETRQIQKTWADEMEEKGIKKGIEKGIEKGQHAILLKLLRLKFGAISPSVEASVNNLHGEALNDLTKNILYVQSLEELLT